MVKKVTTFVTEDGKSFDTESAAKAHEQKVLGQAEVNYRKFFNSYSGKRLLEKYSLDTYGVWEIKGEDDNVDMGGHHYMPSLGLYEGTLEKVIRRAVSIPRFYSWGSGGDIVLRDAIEKL